MVVVALAGFAVRSFWRYDARDTIRSDTEGSTA
jgi:hypothetical protein